jgi:hypothetical protein
LVRAGSKMRIIAYISKVYNYFRETLPVLSKSAEIVPLDLYDTLRKMGPGAGPDDFSLLWDRIFDGGGIDALWSYALPDEITIAAARKHNIPLLIQEFYGHCPERIRAVLPLDCDFDANFPASAEPPAPEPGRDGPPVIVLALSEGLFDESRTIEAFMPKFSPGGMIPMNPFWFPTHGLRSYMELVKMTVDSFKGSGAFSDCILKIRPHPRYKELFQDIADWAERLGDPRVKLDWSPAAESLKEAAVVINVNSNYGFDALRAGRGVVTFGGRAFYASPQLTASPKNQDELSAAMRGLLAEFRKNGARVKPFLPGLLAALKTELGFVAEAPSATGAELLAGHIQNAAKLRRTARAI